VAGHQEERQAIGVPLAARGEARDQMVL